MIPGTQPDRHCHKICGFRYRINKSPAVIITSSPHKKPAIVLQRHPAVMAAVSHSTFRIPALPCSFTSSAILYSSSSKNGRITFPSAAFPCLVLVSKKVDAG